MKINKFVMGGVVVALVAMHPIVKQLMRECFARQHEWAGHAAPRPDLLAVSARNLALDMTKLGVTSTRAETERRTSRTPKTPRPSA